MNWLLLVTILAFPAALGAQHLRPDLQKGLSALLCKSSQSIPESSLLWQAGIYDAQMSAAWIQSHDPKQPLIFDDIGQVAYDQAQAQGHLGFAFGLCGPDAAWIVSTAAPRPLSESRSDGLKFNIMAMRERCQRVSLHYAPLSRGRSKQLFDLNSLDQDSIVLHPELLVAGTLGLICHPKDKQKRGPELWSLRPIHTLQNDLVPAFSLAHKEGMPALIQWIQDVRRREGLKPLQTDHSSLRIFAKQLLADTSIRHPRAQLLEQRKLLAKKNIHILGENRVKATSNEQMAWLLWYSPTHRQLLLDKKATALGFDLAQLSHEKLLVLVVAKI